jgi:hypothetical protein
MRDNYLFPQKCRAYGWVIVCIAIIATIVYSLSWRYFHWMPIVRMPVVYNGLESQKLFTTATCTPIYIIMAMLVIGLLLVGFSREKVEDEFVAFVRMRSMVWAAKVSAVVFILTDLLLFGISFPYGACSIFIFFLFLFVVRFRIALHRFNKGGAQ